jgi:hypothetical protein
MAVPLRFSGVSARLSRLDPETRRHVPVDPPQIVLSLLPETGGGRVREVDLTREQALDLIAETAAALRRVQP